MKSYVIFLALLTLTLADQLIGDPKFNNVGNDRWTLSNKKQMWADPSTCSFCKPYTGMNFILFRPYIDVHTETLKQKIEFPKSGNGTLAFYLRVTNCNGEPASSQDYNLHVQWEYGTRIHVFNGYAPKETDYVRFEYPITIDKGQNKTLVFEYTKYDRTTCPTYISVDYVTLNYDENYIGTWYYVLLGLNLPVTLFSFCAIIYFACSKKNYYKKFR